MISTTIISNISKDYDYSNLPIDVCDLQITEFSDYNYWNILYCWNGTQEKVNMSVQSFIKEAYEQGLA